MKGPILLIPLTPVQQHFIALTTQADLNVSLSHFRPTLILPVSSLCHIHPPGLDLVDKELGNYLDLGLNPIRV